MKVTALFLCSIMKLLNLNIVEESMVHRMGVACVVASA